MELKTLKYLLDVSQRQKLLEEILNFLEDLGNLDYITYFGAKISEGIIPVIIINNNIDFNNIKHVKVFVGAQHNEYNGLFGILEFLKLIKEQKTNIFENFERDQILIFFPLMNPYGFLNPSKHNKSGYYLKNGSNLNRFWRRTFAPEYKGLNDDLNEFPIPENVRIVENIIKKYWEKKDTSIYILDFHETSLLEKITKELSYNLKNDSISYKFDHWLKEVLILNIMKLYNIPYYRKPLFYKCKPSANHTHLNLSVKQIDTVYEKLLDYISKNFGKLPFYLCYGKKSKNYCERLANNVYEKLKDKVWETHFPSFDHSMHDHGCFVKMSDATIREKIYSIELESQKQFFDLFKEIEKSRTEPNYYDKKLKSINLGIELAVENINEMVKLF